MHSLKFDYKNCTNTLREMYIKHSRRKCDINKYYCNRKLFYNSIFKTRRNSPITIAEFGDDKIMESLTTWREYFIKGKIYGFIKQTKPPKRLIKPRNCDIKTMEININDNNEIKKILTKINTTYDIIINSLEQNFNDQIRILINTYHLVNDGGIIIIENLIQNKSNDDYINAMKNVASYFQEHHFIMIGNDRLLVLVKKGNKIFKNDKKLTIITPSYRIDNIKNIYESINFNYVNEWIIVYDGNKIKENPRLFQNDKIKEYVYTDNKSCFGNAQRNFALNNISNKNTYVYFLDDDNIIHPEIYNLLEFLDNDKFYTFVQHNRMHGDTIQIGKIDTAMILIDCNLCKDIRWTLDKYEADGIFICECFNKNQDKWIYVNNVLCYYNKLAQR